MPSASWASNRSLSGTRPIRTTRLRKMLRLMKPVSPMINNAEIDPVPTDGGGRKAEPELDLLSNIIKSFNDLFGNIAWQDTDRIRKLIATGIPNKVAADVAYQNTKKNSDKQNARIEHDKALAGVIVGLMKDDTELFKQFSDNPEFKRWLTDTIFSVTYDRPAPSAP
jgi:type I restriction enzyme, R subunit